MSEDQMPRDEVLWGGPRGPGLVYLVQQNAKAIAGHSESIRKLHEVLHGENGREDRGLVADVSRNTSFRQTTGRGAIWLGGLLGASLIAQLFKAGQWVLAQVAGG